MINVNQTIAYLARLRDPALQQYAQMHKDDPYVLSLALSESNRRKAVRQAAQGQAQDEPDVVDTEIADMAAPMPEDVGIGQLPAGDMNFADGGIVAFSDGGDVPRYQSRGLVQDAASAGTPYGIPGLVQPPSAIYAQPGAAENTPWLQRKIMEMRQEGDRYRLAQAQARITMGQGSKADYELVAKAQEPDMGAASMAEQAAINAATRPGAAAPAAKTVPAPSNTAPKPDTGAAGASRQRPSAGGPEFLGGPGGAAPASGQSIYSLASTPSTYQREFEQFLPQGKVADPFEADVREQGAAEEKVARDYAAKRKAQLEAMGLMGLEQEKRLKAREEKLGKQEGELSGMALLQAGFAMMSGASPNALQNIGVGAQAGLKKYGEGIERLDAAREKIDDAFGRLEIARRSEKMLTDKELAEIERDADKIPAQTRREVINSARTAYGLSHAQAGKMFDAYVADKRLGAELGSRSQIAREDRLSRERVAAAGRPENLYTALGSAAPGSPLRKGFELTKEADKIPRLYGEYTKLVADPMNGSAFEQKYPTFEAFLSAMGGSRAAGFVTPPKDAPVLKPPGGR